MIYLYDGDATDFTYQGKPLPKSYDVDVKFLINDEFYVTFNHPLDENEVYKQIKEDKIITVHTPHGLQPFRILKPQKKETHIRLEAWPLFYADMRNKKVKPLSLTNVDMATALRAFVNNLLVTTPFVFTSNITDRRDYHTQNEDEAENNPNDLFDALEVFKALVSRWKGELYINGYDVRVLDRLGTNTQALLYEKKNISEFVDETNMGSIITRVHGKSEWTDEPIDGETEGKKHSILTTVDSPLIDEYSGIIFEEQYTNNNIRTEQEMINWLNLKFTTDNIDKPRRSITVGTNVINDHHLSVGDSIILKYIKHDIDMSIRMIGYNYDGYDNMYKQVVLGEAKSSVSGTINRDVSESNNQYKELEKNTLKWLDDIRFAITNSYFNEDGYNYDLQADNEYGLPGGYYSFNAPIYNNPSKAIYMGAGKLLIANSKDTNGEWIWQTALDGDGVNASTINTGVLNAELVQVGLNNIYTWMKLTEQGLTMEGNDGWRRSLYGAESIGYYGGYSGYDENVKAGAIGIFRTNYYPDNGQNNWFSDQETQRMNIAMAVNYNYKLSLGYSPTENVEGRKYRTFMTFDPRYTGNNPTNLWYTPHEWYIDTNRVLKISDRITVHAVLDMDGYEIANPSDVRLKTNIKDVDFDARQEILKAGNLKQYEWNKDIKKNANKPSGEQIGLLAQENPFFANMESENVHYLTISLNKQVNVMFQALKDEIADHENTKQELKELKELLKEKGVI